MQGRDVAIVAGVVVLVILVLGLLGGGMMGFGGMMGGYYGSGFAGPWMAVLMLLFWALVIGGVVLLVVWLVRQGSNMAPGSASREDTALELLKRRYARGEITRDQFEQMRRDLE